MDGHSCLFLIPEEPESDDERLDGRLDPSLVMAEQQTHDVVDQSLSVGDLPPSDVPATQNSIQASGGDEVVGVDVASDRLDGQNDISASDDKVDTTYVAPHLSSSFTNSNGVPQYIANGDEGSINASGGSDTDTSRAEIYQTGDGIKHHERRESMKRPATYKPVSFAKFAVNKGGSASPGPKTLSEKTPVTSTVSLKTASQLSSKPRLVAKSTSGLRDAAPKSLKGSGRNGSSGPDPLQQQYGIHLTSRIQADGEGKESKWADIDDDEEDWALPETLQWSDGTKAYLTGSESTAAPNQGQKPAPVRAEQPKDARISKPTSIPITSTVGPNATVLKLGASAERQQQQAKTTALQPKGPTEKPIQPTVKAPAPVPAKSPWAVLPPVDKISPVAINPQTSIPPVRQPSNELHSEPPLSGSALSPAKEISADDFNRSWRQDQDAHPRELFMPNSGRYEAVNEGKRRLNRNDQNFRAPSVLQRPNQGNYHAPAEPSAAFQTHRTSEQDRAPWSRRRTSSNVSGGSGAFDRRMSMGKTNDTLAFHDNVNQRQDSEVVSQDTVSHGQASAGASKPAAPYIPSPSEMTPSSAVAPGAIDEFSKMVGPAPRQDGSIAISEDVERQKQLMKEKREAAIKRRQEQEAREEAEKRERIRLKMESLGLPPLDDKSRSKESKPQESSPQKSPAIANTGLAAAKSTSPIPKPPIPVPEASGEPKQYGMMKVHHPDSVKKLVGAQDRPVERTSAASRTTPDSLSKSSIPENVEPSQANGIRPSPDSPPRREPDPSMGENGQKQSDTATANINGAPSMPGWKGTRLNQNAASNGSLWGPPSNNKALGNGTFNQNLAAFPPRDPSRDALDQSQIGSHWNGRPGNIGKSPQMPSAQPIPLDATLPGSGPASPDQRPVAANSEADSAQPTSRPAPIGPPQPSRFQPSPIMRAPNHNLAAWNNFSQSQARDDHAYADRFRQGQEEAKTESQQAPNVVYQETFRQVKAGDAAGQRQIVGVTKSTNGPPLPPGPQFGPVGSLPGQPAQPSSLPPRAGGSRFFQQQQMNSMIRPASSTPQRVPLSPSPPPAEEAGSPHPAYNEENLNRPRVSFPTPKAVVKLPPAVAVTPPPPLPPVKPQPVTFAAIAAKAPSPPKQSLPPTLGPQNWQDKFRGLFDKAPSSHEKKQSLPVTVSSKEPFDYSTGHPVAPVSLPQTDSESEGELWSSKFMDEEEMFEDRVAGSLPTVRVASRVFPHTWHAARIHPRKTRAVRAVDSASIQAFSILDLDTTPRSKELTVLIRVPGGKEIKSKSIPRKGVHQPHSRTPRHASGVQKHRKAGPRPREPSKTHSAIPDHRSKTGPAPPPPAPSTNSFMNAPKGAPNHNTFHALQYTASVSN
ncbi:MAG: hypothetical protein Q9227_002682 [Pyrenula ochraceoflavens]